MKKLKLIALAAALVIAGCSEKAQQTQVIKQQLAKNDYRASGILAKPLPEIVEALNNGEINSQALVNLYLERINAVDKNGPRLQAILTLNPDALDDAIKLDSLRTEGLIKGPLHGVPILLKDNIESLDNMPTTAGSFALKDNITGRDSPLVAGLRAQGAIILGKTNLSQWANFRSESSMSGWSALGGQVKNPHMLDRNPCGSSSGSGAAAAASLAAGTVGTETDGSIICPANANGIVGFKPTVGIVLQQHIVPISASQDTAGPMTKTVRGAAMLLNAMATESPDIDYVAGLSKHALKGVRVGVLNFATGSAAPVNQLFTAALAELEAAGAILINIENRPTRPDGFDKMGFDILKYEFKAGLNAYLTSTSVKQVKTRSLQELITFNQQHAELEMALFDQSIFVASEALGSLESDEYNKALEIVQKTTREEGIDKLIHQYNVKVLVAPSGPTSTRIDPINGDVWPGNWPGFGSYAAQAGYPHATVPMGSNKSLPLGLSFIGTKNTDTEILAYAYAYEQFSMLRVEPQYLSHAEDIPAVANAMKSNASH